MKRTPLHDAHVRLGARMITFADWEMPVWYAGLTAEHQSVRERVGLFDVSHMGEFVVHGPDALQNLQRLLCNDAGLLADGQVQYSLIMNDAGGVVDDLLVYRLSASVFLLVVNASNIDKDRAWLVDHLQGDATLDDRSDDNGLVALQGPLAPAVLSEVTRLPVWTMGYYHFERGEVAGIQALVSRTGYTGEDGFEIMVDAPDTPRLWDALMSAGAARDIAPAGLGARDSLRLEASMPLYGHELDDTTSPLEAGLGRFVQLDKPEMLGIDRLRREKAEGVARRLVGLEMVERGIPRQGYVILHDGAPVGVVTSGTQSPTLGTSIGMGYVRPDVAAVGTPLAVEVRGQNVAAKVVRRPFYKRDRPV